MRISELKKQMKGRYGHVFTHRLCDRAIVLRRAGMLSGVYTFNGTEHKTLKDAFEEMKRYVGAPE